MSRGYVSCTDHRWVMCCDECGHESDPRAKQSDLPLSEFALAGWFVADLFGDRCPPCVLAGGGIAEISKRVRPGKEMRAVTS